MTTTVAADIDWTLELDRHRPWMLKVLRSRVGDWHVADDLIQEVALAVWKQTSRPLDPAKVAPWLYRLTVRQAINFHRRSKMQKLQHWDGDESAVPANNGKDVRIKPIAETVGRATLAPTPLDWLIEEEKTGAIRAALQRARPRDRELLTLKYSENWTYQQLADHLGVKVKTIEYRLLKAKQRLRRLIVQDF
jgi:RNA polymerase sigma-70 factor (ECF subfamily)